MRSLLLIALSFACSEEMAPDDAGPDPLDIGVAPDAPAKDTGPSDDAGDDAEMSDAGDGEDAGEGVDVDLPEGFGWIELPDTTLEAVCPFDEDPLIAGIEGCSAIIEDWSGGIADTRRSRLIVWGGGHGGYFGNELYALDLASQQMLRLNDPSVPWPDTSECSTVTSSGTAASRHTYDGLAYIEHADRMFVFGGAPACYPGGISNDTWTFDFATSTWESRDPHNGETPGARPGAIADYDPSTGLVYLHDTQLFWSYNVDTNTYALLRDHLNDGTNIDYHLSGRIDLGRQLFVLMGGGELHAIDVSLGSNFEMRDLAGTGCDEVVNAAYPGVAYDPNAGGIVAWAGGDTVYLFDPESESCTPWLDAGGPGPQVDNGTNGRWRYFPALGIFALVNQWDQNAFLFRPQR